MGIRFVQVFVRVRFEKQKYTKYRDFLPRQALVNGKKPRQKYKKYYFVFKEDRAMRQMERYVRFPKNQAEVDGQSTGYSGAPEKWRRQAFGQSALFKGLRDNVYAIFWEAAI